VDTHSPNEDRQSLEGRVPHALHLKFSTGLRLCELRSIALVVAQIAGIPPPPRSIRRLYSLLVSFFTDHWGAVLPILPILELLDGDHRPIHGRREMSERGIVI
jgi:hypothetical protein